MTTSCVIADLFRRPARRAVLQKPQGEAHTIVLARIRPPDWVAAYAGVRAALEPGAWRLEGRLRADLLEAICALGGC